MKKWMWVLLVVVLAIVGGLISYVVFSKDVVGDIQPLFEVSSPEVILSPEERMQLGLNVFPDGITGIFKHSGQYYFFASGATWPSDGSYYHDGTIRLIGNLENMVPNPVDINGCPLPSLSPNRSSNNFDKDYAGGGPIYYDEINNQLIHFYHGEYHFDASNPTNFYSSIGLAVSNDLGQHFTKLGEIIRPRIPRKNNEQVEVSGASIVRNGDYFYLYYSDKDPVTHILYIALARAKINEVLNFAGQGQVSRWKKYYNGAFNEPGKGGQFTPLFGVEPSTWSGWPFVGYNSYLHKYVMVYMVGWNGPALRLSNDGITWSEPIQIITASEQEVIFYYTFVGTGENPNKLGQEFWMYYTYALKTDPPEASWDWQTAKWMRVKIRFAGPEV